MIEVNHMRATGRFAAEMSDFFGGERGGHPVRVLSHGIDCGSSLSYVMRADCE